MQCFRFAFETRESLVGNDFAQRLAARDCGIACAFSEPQFFVEIIQLVRARLVVETIGFEFQKLRETVRAIFFQLLQTRV